MLKQNKAITLIALIITIIVLLILAGVVINMTLGNDGIISKAQSAVDKYQNAQEKEEYALAKAESYIGNYRGGEVTDELVDAIADKLIKKGLTNPTGTIIAFYGSTAPTGYLVCDGSSKEISKYKDLAEFLGADINNDTTFNLPDLTNKFLKGSNISRVNESAGLPNITGDTGAVLWGGNPRSTTGNGALRREYNVGRNASTASSSDNGWFLISFDASLSNSIYGHSTTVTPENISVLYCIKY